MFEWSKYFTKETVKPDDFFYGVSHCDLFGLSSPEGNEFLFLQ